MTQYSTLRVEQQGAVSLLTLDRPQALNALSFTMMAEFVNALSDIKQSNSRALVITGAGRAFAAGADIAEMRNRSFGEMTDADHLSAWEQLADLRIPTIAAVNGYALGGGCELAMMCDIIVAGTGSAFGQPEIGLGIIPGIGGTQRLARTVGKSIAMDLVLTGRRIDGAEAYRIGLVSRLVDDNEVLKEALDVAQLISKSSGRAVRAAKECVLRAQHSTLAEGLLFERRWFHSLFAFDDQTEGMSAFLDKRVPEFSDG